MYDAFGTIDGCEHSVTTADEIFQKSGCWKMLTGRPAKAEVSQADARMWPWNFLGDTVVFKA